MCSLANRLALAWSAIRRNNHYDLELWYQLVQSGADISQYVHLELFELSVQLGQHNLVQIVWDQVAIQPRVASLQI